MADTHSTVLVIDGETQIRRFLRTGFELDGYAVIEAATGDDGLRAATMKQYDLVILEPVLPDVDGSQLLARLRSWSTVPVIILSARGAEEDKVRLLDAGADDYVVKPFGMAELLARARVALRRRPVAARSAPVVKAGRLTVDLPARTVLLDDVRLNVTPKEYRLLQVLAQHVGNVVTHQHLLKEVWGAAHQRDIHYLRIFVRKLRQKIERDVSEPRILLTELGVGYRLSNEAEADAAE